MNTKYFCALVIVLQGVAAGAANYYVNDASTIGDVFCSAPGALVNSGTTTSAPKASLADVLSTYALAPGDAVFIDSGNFTNATTPVVGPADSGSQIGGVV